MKRIPLLLFFFVSISLFGQKPPAKFGDIPMEDMKMTVYPLDSSASAVVLVDYGESTIRYSKANGFQIIFERLRRVKILTKEGLKWGDFSIPLYHDSDQEEKISELKVATYNLESGKIVDTKTKKDAFIKEKYNANLNFTKVPWANVKEGSVLEIAYTVTSDFLFNFQDWEFQTTIPTRWSEYRAHIPEYFNYEKYMQGYVMMDISENDFSSNSFTVNYTQRSGGTGFSPTNTSFHEDKVEYRENNFRWATKDIPAFKKEPFMTTSEDYISKINFELSYTNFSHEFSNPGIKRYMGTWEDINNSYWENVGGIISGNNSLKDQVTEILTGLTAPDQKVAAIYNYVRQNILWDGTNRKYAERSPKKTLEEKKGNSAEINFLLACMLEKAEIDVNPVLLSTRDHGFVRETMPVSTQFNYVACRAKIDDKFILLDATDKLLPPGMLPEKCLNGNGFVVSKEGYQWVSLRPSVKTKTTIVSDLSFTDDGSLKGSITIDKIGYSSADARRDYFAKGEQGYLSAFTNGRSWTISKSEFKNVNEIQLPFKEAHDLIINEHFTSAGNTIYLSPFILAKMEENPFKLEKRIYPVDFGHPFDHMYLVKINIPAGYEIDELPKSKVIMLPENSAKYTYNAAQVGNTISVTSSLVISKSLFIQQEYPNLREFYSQLVAKQAEQIVLKKKQK